MHSIIPFHELSPFLKRIDLIAWDCDGTLVDNESKALDVICEEISNYVIQRAHEEGLPFERSAIDCCRPLAGRPLPEIRMVYSDYIGLPIPESVDTAIRNRRKQSPEQGEVVKAIKPLAELAYFFKQNGLYQRIATSSEPDRALRYIEAAGLTDVFEPCKKFLFEGHKPLPDAHRAARESLKETPFGKEAHPKRTIGIEDSVSGIKACVADGIIPIGHALPSHISCSKKHAEKLLAAGAVAVIKKPEDVIPVFKTVLSSLPVRPDIPVVISPKAPWQSRLAIAGK